MMQTYSLMLVQMHLYCIFLHLLLTRMIFDSLSVVIKWFQKNFLVLLCCVCFAAVVFLQLQCLILWSLHASTSPPETVSSVFIVDPSCELWQTIKLISKLLMSLKPLGSVFSVRRTKTFQSFYNTVTAASVFQTHLNTCISPEAARAHTGKYTQSNASSSVKNEYVSKSHALVFRGTFALWCSCILSLSDRTPWFCLISKVFQIWSNHT